MKKHLKYPRIAIFLCVFFTLIESNSNCTKENSLEKPKKEFDNPYKKYGIIHNQILGEILANNNLKGIDKKELWNIVQKTFEKHEYKTNTKDSISEDQLNAMEDCINPNPKVFVDSLYSKGFLNVELKTKLDSYVENVLPEDGFSNCYGKLTDFELSVANDGNISDQSRDFLLGFTGVAKESAIFWSENNTSKEYSIWIDLGADGFGFAVFMLLTGGNFVAGVKAAVFFSLLANSYND